MALNDFITHVKQTGMFIGNKFEIVAPFVDGASNTAAATVSMLCNSVNMPGITIMSNDVRHFGESMERPNGISYSPVSMTFYADNSLSAKRYFEQWQSLIFNRETRELGYYDSYVRDVEIVVYNKAEEEIERIKLYEAYPKVVGDIPLDYSSNSTSILSVQLIYKWWEAMKKDRWEGATPGYASQVPSFEHGQYGHEGIGINAETLSNITGNTFSGQGSITSPSLSFLGSDIGSSFQNAGSNILTEAGRNLGQSSDLFAISNLATSQYPNMGMDFSGNMQSMLGNFGGLGNGMRSIGGNLDNILPGVNQMSNGLGGLSLDTANYGNLIRNLGGSSDISSLANQMGQANTYFKEVQKYTELPKSLNSIAGNFGNIGSAMQQAADMLNGSGEIDRTSYIAMVNAARTYTNSGSWMSMAAASILG
jgi:hypothetical protein